ncbi:hypothetical protein ILP97_23795 [Amycolatopsis sp. H6(2020)]|nr:hypothetical protein [Amycolatopsis sp. H6(2020)]
MSETPFQERNRIVTIRGEVFCFTCPVFYDTLSRWGVWEDQFAAVDRELRMSVLIDRGVKRFRWP